MTKSLQVPSKTVQTTITSTDNNNTMNINNDCTAALSTKKKKKNKKKSKTTTNSSQAKAQADMVDAMMNHHVIRHGENHAKNIQKKIKNKNNQNEDDSFWSSTNNTEERQKIREFWLQLGEEERRSLVKVEKEAVLRKMKEQQKHSCNCSVCGKKRTAIEDELEVLYDAYYEELEQYANHQQQTRGSSSSSAIASLPRSVSYIRGGRIYHNGYDDTLDEDDDEDDEEDEDDEDDEDIDILGDEDEDEDEEYDEEEDDDDIMTRPPISAYPEKSRFEEMTHIRPSKSSSTNGDHFSFGNSLTVKGGILTVADDLLKNDGKKFLDMMERLAERRMQKEDISLEQNTNYFQEEDDDDEEAYEEEEDEDTRTEEQRMEEGRRMFQIFAARMFEQRVLAAYREKVAQERQQRLLEELEEEDRLREEREAKKQLEREKKKDKKRQLKKQQEEERLAREAKRKAEEEALRKQKEKKLEEERQRREQERLKKEEEKRQREEERQRKEEERKRKLKEEKEREKKRKEKEEKERKEREERERKEKEEERTKREHEEKEEEEKKKKLEEEERLKQEASKSNAVPMQDNSSSSADFESRQQALIEALVGSSSRQPNFIEPTNIQPPLTPLQPPHSASLSLPPQPSPLSHLQQQQPFMPISRHLGGVPAPFVSSSLEHPSPLSDPNVMGLFHSRSTTMNSPLLSETPSTRRSITPIAPIGQRLHPGHRALSVQPTGPIGSLQDDTLMGNKRMEPEGGAARSFFSSFLFGEPTKYHNNTMLPNDTGIMQDNRRFSSDSQNPSSWTNGWTASSLLSDNVHGKLFGDALPDRTAITLERAKVAYQKLNEITQVKMFTEYHTLVQLHCMMNDLYMDFPIDIRELYDVLSSPISGFQCLHHGQHGIVVLYDANSTSPSHSSLLLPSHPPPSLQPPGNNAPLFS
ncbi:hypothetical protein G6F46_005252 [Rhizopus delemar]|uniref:Stress response protein NST1 n=2 Tax=Rhizopus TaxID=4842 RepID=A0A9P6Z1Z0_9FUNG|nr:hypothetical protein G6F55_006779 [Rhizopus delemar]KAG1542553.1 hypothetical protein G6F51_007205 [Rhizopus arrhizus]KAG1496585.1 hypothetical protein G6F54_006366 [Rhizopus delemar]KAG1510313.1 hypothetical protein G6F53_006779 [Rhizopus delemar]KAG1525809.1 hypothetical protein G6F52_002993 [Rhizopus delemar]